MNFDTNIEQKLRRAGEQLKSDRDMTQAVMQQIEQLPPPHLRPFVPPRWLAVAASIAAIVGIAVPVLVVLLKSPTLAYADVVKSINDVKTARLELRTMNPAVYHDFFTCIYERGVGFRMEGEMEKSKFLLIDNGKRQWTRTGDGELQESASMGLIDQFKKVLLAGGLLEGTKRDASGDEEIDGVRCRLFSKPAQAEQPGARVWIDDQNHVRKMETLELREGKPKATQVALVHYDVPIDRSLFMPPLIAASKPVRMDERIDQYLPLDSAAAKTEVFGLVVAIHEVRVSPDGILLVRSSLRPNAEMLKKFSPGFGWNPLASYQLDISGYQSIPMSSYQKQRLIAQWDFFMPMHPNTPLPKKVVVRADGVWTEDELEASLKRDGKKTYINDLAIGQATVAPAKSTGELLDETWNQASSLYSVFTPVFFREIKTQTDGKTVYPTTPITEWTRQRLQSEFEAQLKAMREFNDRQQRERARKP